MDRSHWEFNRFKGKPQGGEATGMAGVNFDRNLLGQRRHLGVSSDLETRRNRVADSLPQLWNGVLLHILFSGNVGNKTKCRVK
jgi:hypothetical protein